MTEEIQTKAEEPEVVIEQPEEQEIVVETEEKPEEKKSDWVELPPEAQKKFNDMYKQTKMSDQRNKFLLEANQKALALIEKLEKRFSQTDEAEAEKVLLNRIVEARDNGDTQAELRLIAELTDFKAEAKLRGIKQPKPEPINVGLPEDDVRTIADAVWEQDETGNYTRPWLHENHPKYGDALKHATIISAQVQQELGVLDTQEVLARLDNVMKKPTQPPKGNSRAPDPMGGNLTTRNPRGTLKLSSAEAEIARKLGIDTKVYAQTRDALRKQ